MRSPRPLPPELGSVFPVSAARDAGVSRSRTRARDLESPFHGVRSIVGLRDHESMCRAYLARMPERQVFSHATAARLWGLPLPYTTDDRLHVSAPDGSRQPRARGVVGHRLGAGLGTALLRALPVLDASDAWCQLASSLRLDDLIAAGDRLIGWPRPLVSIDDVDAAIVRFGSRRGARALRAAREEVRPGSASPRETRLRLWVTRAGFPEPECNGAVEIPGGPTLHGDLVFRARRVILEYDGDQHRDADQFRRDIGRLNALALAGWTVIRVSGKHTRAQVLNDLTRALA